MQNLRRLAVSDRFPGLGVLFFVLSKTGYPSILKWHSRSQIVNLKDAKFIVSYELRGGPISCQDMLSAALNGLTLLAVRHNHDQCHNFAGFSSSGSVIYAIRSTLHRSTLVFLSYIWVRTALKLLPVRLYERGSCAEV